MRAKGKSFRLWVGLGFVALLYDPSPTFAATAPDLGQATSFGVLAASTVTNTGQSVIIAWQFHSSSFAVLEQTNDYSFDASKVNAADWDRVVLMRSGSAIWGIPP